MSVHTPPAPAAHVAPCRVTPQVGAARIALPHDLLLEIVTSLARRCHEDGELIEHLVALGSACADTEDHDLRQLLGQEHLDNRVFDAQAPFRDLAATWDVPLSEAAVLAIDLLRVVHAPQGQAGRRRCLACDANPAMVDHPYCLSCEERVAS